MPALTVFSATTPEPSYDRPRPDRLLQGNPLRTTHEHFLAATGQVSAGIWQCEPGAWKIAFAPGKDEFFCVIEGRLRITDENGQASEYSQPVKLALFRAGLQEVFEVL